MQFPIDYPLILGFGVLRRSTDDIHVVVSFSLREKGLLVLLRALEHTEKLI